VVDVITRYDLAYDSGSFETDAKGKWVRFDDIETPLAMAKDLAERLIGELDGVEHGQIRDHAFALLAALKETT
jgi:hypothetical protein